MSGVSDMILACMIWFLWRKMTARYRDCTKFSGVLSSYIQYGAIIVMYLGTVTGEQYVIHRTRRPAVCVTNINLVLCIYMQWIAAYSTQVICINATLFLVNHLKKVIWIKTAKVPIQEQGKSEGFDSCRGDRPSNLTQIGFKSSIFQPVWP